MSHTIYVPVNVTHLTSKSRCDFRFNYNIFWQPLKSIRFIWTLENPFILWHTNYGLYFTRIFVFIFACVWRRKDYHNSPFTLNAKLHMKFVSIWFTQCYGYGLSVCRFVGTCHHQPTIEWNAMCWCATNVHNRVCIKSRTTVHSNRMPSTSLPFDSR